MITWECFKLSPDDRSFHEGTPFPAEVYRGLAQRGLAQFVRFNPKYIPMAQAMQKAGARVIAMEGGGGEGPGAEAPDTLHQFEAGYTADGRPHACPLLFRGWHNRAMAVRAMLEEFRAAGVVLDAAWLDWEFEPWWTESRWEQSRHCTRCRELFPPAVLADANRYRDFIVQLRQKLYSTYLAAPILEAYPRCRVTNWAVVYSSPERPALHYWGRFRFPPMDAGLFTALNPVAYGNDIYHKLHWQRAWDDPDNTPLDQVHMDRLYTHIMLAQVSDNAWNEARWQRMELCAPWVARYCPDVNDPKIPILSRARYREILRHIWFRGADTMQIFNAHRKQHPAIATEEVEDAVAVYDEVLALRPFLDRGDVLNTVVPTPMEDGPVWSGLRNGKQAVVRAFTQGSQHVSFSCRPWADGPHVQLSAPPDGQTFILTLDVDGTVRVDAP
jgi:hypothetical protein